MRYDFSARFAFFILHVWLAVMNCQSQTSPNRNKRVSPDPKDVDWSTLKDLFPLDNEFPDFTPAHNTESTKSKMLNERRPASSTASSSDLKKWKAERTRLNSQRRKIESADEYQAMLKRKREQMKFYRSRMTPEQLQIHKAKHVKNQRAHEAKMLAKTGFRSTYLADLEKLRKDEKQGTITPEDNNKLAILRKKTAIRNRKYQPRKRVKAVDKKKTHIRR